ncbi:autotransporter outer membrane beta-barrel domain-containing protein [Stenotrophomonas sp.]|uniref:autotransporter outer membrane beta-barrel domain-containing protein n=1 Tax=Stenotrophomonas sp. TaxID=69392 RepID=UPI002899FC71|nr:autotransporter outer membrane beta-barrel domain-containing protein [Stenotrophomonas sp.]
MGEGHSTAGASVSPYLAANWYRDGASNGMAFDDAVLKASVPRNRYELDAGARVDFRSGLSAWGGLGVMRGDHGYREATANLSVAYKWQGRTETAPDHSGAVFLCSCRAGPCPAALSGGQ